MWERRAERRVTGQRKEARRNRRKKNVELKWDRFTVWIAHNDPDSPRENRWGDASENKAAGLMGLTTMIKANMTTER